MRIWQGFLAMGALMAAGQTARADELVVLSAAAVKTVMADVPARFEAATGTKVRFVFGTAGVMHDQAVAGGPFDLAIIPPAPLADLVKRGLVNEAGRHDLGTVRLGAAVRTGTPVPKIDTEAAFTATLLAAPSIGMADPATGATSGIYLAKLMERLGVADAVKPKLHFYPEGQTAMEAGARGEVALGLGQISEITPVAGMTLIGPIPDSLQLRTIYAAGLASKSSSPDKAAALMQMLAGPDLVVVFQRNGFDAGS
jgi:molybdate transport system substrate-binding protein